ncbi:hypothetical protein M0R45_036280 [Rubus argutus]|uniref:Uncharacterized protein n=1 Tax=Rubus argutus TaxID=59490 RepID=A0AAW1W0N0_RUBAR
MSQNNPSTFALLCLKCLETNPLSVIIYLTLGDLRGQQETQAWVLILLSSAATSALLGVFRSLMVSLALHDLSVHLFQGSSGMGRRCYGCGRGVWGRAP